MKRRMAVALLLVFAATTASEAQSSGGRSRGGHSSGARSGGGRSSGGHSVSRGASGGHSSVSRYSGARSGRSYSGRSYSSGARYSPGARYSSGARSSSGRSGGSYSSRRGIGSYYGGGHAVPRGSAGYTPRSSTEYRHPRAGYGTGYSYGSGSRYYGSRAYGHRSYGYGYSSRYPYYGYSSYYGGYGYRPYGWGGLSLGLSFYYGYPSVGVGVYSAPYYADDMDDGAYAGGASYPTGDDARRDDGAELRLLVVPEDASVWIDSEFRGTARSVDRLTLGPGRHEIEVVRPGFRSTTREIQLQPGASNSLRIELERP